MPLPVATEKQPWPPKHLAAHFDRVREHAAWWSGDTAGLTTAYGAMATGTSTKESSFDPAGAGRLRFWSRRSRDTGKARSALHIPMAGEVATTSADLLFAQPPTLRLPAPDAPAAAPGEASKKPKGNPGQDRLDQLVELAGLDAVWLEGAEAAAALSGVYLRPGWDTDLMATPFVTVVQPDAAVPEWRHGRLVAVTFYTVLPDPGKTVWRHLERHEMLGGHWVIEHGLYAGDKDHLGVRQSNRLNPYTEALPDEPINTGVPFLGVAYVPNMRPNRRDRNSPLGRSDIDGLTGILDALDETWTEWIAELRLARARIIVPESYMEHAGAGKGQFFDHDREVFTPVAVPTAPGMGDAITMTTFPIRAEKFAATALALTERIVDGAGYSPQDFGLHIEGRAESGTALRLRRGRSLATVAKKQRYWQPAISRSTLALLWLDKTMLNNRAAITPAPDTAVEVEWQAEVDLPEMAGTVGMIATARAASVDTMVRMLHPEWDDEQVAAEVALVQAEQGIVGRVPAPDDPMFMG